MTRLVATFFFVGLLRPAPGTWGSVAAVFAAWLLHWLTGPTGLAIAIVVVFAAGVWAVAAETEDAGEADPSEIVIDEVAGQWIALVPVSVVAAHAGVGFPALWPGVLTAFLAFRLFDIWKPWLIGRVDARGTPLSVMLDDALAGVFAAVAVGVGAWLAHGMLGA